VVLPDLIAGFVDVADVVVIDLMNHLRLPHSHQIILVVIAGLHFVLTNSKCYPP
jgi:hypothetical protein